MRGHMAAGLAAASFVLLALSGCAPGESGSSGPYGSTPESEPPAETTPVGLATTDTPLGTIVVDSEGNAVYQFDQDTQGASESSCAGQCLENWPPVPAAEDAPDAEGITGEIGSITGTDGDPQLTLNGWPLYYYIGDEQPGDTAGQGVNEVWWVLTPAGSPITG